MSIAVWTGAAVAYGLSLLRWLRVAQREHYLSRTVTRFGKRWWMARPVNQTLLAVALVSLGLSVVYPAAGLATALAAIVGPVGLSPRGRTSPLRWTGRMRRLGSGVVILTAGLVMLAALAGLDRFALLTAGIALPILVDGTLAGIAPLERALSARFVNQARAALDRIHPTVIAITGSYGKTTTKNYLARLLQDGFATVASPASFNNRLGLARAINEHLAAGTEVFIAEMGTYGKGEIAELNSWIRPRVGVITAIGPVHLERFRSLEAIVAAKAEILEGVDTAVLNVDEPHLEQLAGRLTGIRVITCSERNHAADVCVDAAGTGRVLVGGRTVAMLGDRTVFAGNLACAIGAGLSVDMPLDGLERTIGDLQAVEHRQAVTRGTGGFAVIDDTYNSNPAGARAALDALDGLSIRGRRVVVTPGMVELGVTQHHENLALATEASRRATDIIVVGRTNRDAWREGAGGGSASVMVMDSREEAVRWVRANLGEGDAVLYENDLPDHYP